MSIKIERLKKEEIGDVIDFHDKYLGSRSFINKREILKRMKDNTGIFLVAKDGDKIVGIKFGYIDRAICIGRGIAVEEEYRDMGIGKKLVKKFEKVLKEYPEVLEYYFGSDSKDGVPFHIKMGYTPSLLIQYTGEKRDIDIEGFAVEEHIYNPEYRLYQVILTSHERELDSKTLENLRIELRFATLTYLFEKPIKDK